PTSPMMPPPLPPSFAPPPERTMPPSLGAPPLAMGDGPPPRVAVRSKTMQAPTVDPGGRGMEFEDLLQDVRSFFDDGQQNVLGGGAELPPALAAAVRAPVAPLAPYHAPAPPPPAPSRMPPPLVEAPRETFPPLVAT